MLPFFLTLFFENNKMENGNYKISYEGYKASIKAFTFICKDEKKYIKQDRIVLIFDSEDHLDEIINESWESLNKSQNELER